MEEKKFKAFMGLAIKRPKDCTHRKACVDLQMCEEKKMKRGWRKDRQSEK